MLIRFNDTVVNLNLVSDFNVTGCNINFYFSQTDGEKEPAVIICNFKTNKNAERIFDRIIFSYSQEYKILDLTNYEYDEDS